jgi:hypothetical protein
MTRKFHCGLILTACAVSWLPGAADAVRAPTDLEAKGHFLYRGDKPVLLLGDTVWPLAVRFDDEQVRAYLDNARQLGFNLIALFETTPWAVDDPLGKNVFGEEPYRNRNPWDLNEKYWERYRFVLEEAAKRDMYVYLCVGGPLRPKTPWSRLDSAQKAYDYGHALGRFFARQNRNLIWSPGSDQNPDTVDRERVDDVAEGIADGVNGIHRLDGKADYGSTFMSYHTCGGKTTADYFHDKAWLDFNGFQTWRKYEQTVPMARRQYEKQPVKPGIDHEPAYEGDLSHKEPEVKTGWHSRMQAYWSLFSGSCGHINGTTGIWDLGTSRWRTYEEGLRSEGRNDLQWVRKLLESQPLDGRVPDQSLIVSDPHQPDRHKDYVCATRGRNGEYAFVYTTKGESFELDLGKLRKGRLTARWYDPRSGRFRDVPGSLAPGRQTFDPPGEPGDGNDYVLVVVGK